MKLFNMIKNDTDFKKIGLYYKYVMLFNQMCVKRLSAMFPRVIRRVFVM